MSKNLAQRMAKAYAKANIRGASTLSGNLSAYAPTPDEITSVMVDFAYRHLPKEKSSESLKPMGTPDTTIVSKKNKDVTPLR